MSKRADKRNDHAAAVFVATTLLAACSPDATRDGSVVEPATHQAGLETIVDDGMSRHAAIERRHFDIYDDYRKLSDQRADQLGVRVQDAVIRPESAGISLIPVCSMRAMLMGD